MLRYSTINLPCTAEAAQLRRKRLLGHAIFGFLGARPLFAEHTQAEHEALKRWASGRSALAEIGVAEGVSALAIREAMHDHGTLALIDPFHLSRLHALNFTRRAAHRVVESCPRGRVQWIEKFSYEAFRKCNQPLDFLLIDGDHSEAGVRRDWEDWSPLVKAGGVVVFHDARTFEGGWPDSDWGPVVFVNEMFRRNPASGWRMVDEVDSLVVVKREE